LSLLRHRVALHLIGLVLGAIFLYASYDKIAHPRDFAKIVYHYRMLGPSQTMSPGLANVFSVALPWVEAVTGLLLVTGLWRREAALVAAVMLIAFLVAVSWAMTHGVNLANCGCFSVSEGGDGRTLGWKLLAGDGAMLLAALGLMAAKPAQAEREDRRSNSSR
jgi:cobalt-zinc-cadmium efflux system protein